MNGRIPEDKINEIRTKIDIVDFISEYVQLTKQGRNYFGLCPFHGESTPSFSVSPEKQIFHCFGCQAGGNVFSFLMDIEGISFQEAAVKLAEHANVPLDMKVSERKSKKDFYFDKMIEAHELLRKFYHHILVNTNDGQEALEYLHSRGFTDEVIDYFQIGFALNKRDIGLNFLKGRGFTESFLEEAGLISQSNEGDYFDRFRGRIVFPIFDNKGNTVAFSGRALYDDGPKYLNSPETAIFQKSRILYNFHKARPHIRKKEVVVIFEGFADCISAHRAGVENGIATMGTALTEEHIHLIKRNTNRVILCFDADEAGQKATYSAGEMLQEKGLQVQVAIIPNGKDPDDYIQMKGPELFQKEVIGMSLTFTAFKIRYLKLGKNLQNEGEQLLYIEQVLLEISKLTSAIEQDMYIRQLAEEFSLSLDALKMQLRQIIFKSKKNISKQEKSTYQNIALVNTDKKQNLAYYNAERMLIAHMLKSIQSANKVQQSDFSFIIDEHQAIATYLYAYYEEGNEPDLSNFINFINDQELRKTATEIGMITINDELSDKELQDYIYQVLKHQKMQIIKQKVEESKEAERAQDFAKAKSLLAEIIELRKSLN